MITLKMINEDNKIRWISKNKHLIIAIRDSFYTNDKNKIFVVYREKRNYSKFNSYFFYEIAWSMQRWEETLEKAIQYASTIPDEALITE